MADYKTIKFNGILYPYVEMDIYDYERNSDIHMKVGTTDLLGELISGLTSKDPEIKSKAESFDSDFKKFVPRKILINKSEEYINKWILDHPDNQD